MQSRLYRILLLVSLAAKGFANMQKVAGAGNQPRRAATAASRRHRVRVVRPGWQGIPVRWGQAGGRLSKTNQRSEGIKRRAMQEEAGVAIPKCEGGLGERLQGQHPTARGGGCSKGSGQGAMSVRRCRGRPPRSRCKSQGEAARQAAGKRPHVSWAVDRQRQGGSKGGRAVRWGCGRKRGGAGRGRAAYSRKVCGARRQGGFVHQRERGGGPGAAAAARMRLASALCCQWRARRIEAVCVSTGLAGCHAAMAGAAPPAGPRPAPASPPPAAAAAAVTEPSERP